MLEEEDIIRGAPHPAPFCSPKRLHKKGALENLRDVPLRSDSGKQIQTPPFPGLGHESLFNPAASLRYAEIFGWARKERKISFEH